VIAGVQPAGLQRGADGSRFVVDLPPRHSHRLAVFQHRRADKDDARFPVGRQFQPFDCRSSHRIDSTGAVLGPPVSHPRPPADRH